MARFRSIITRIVSAVAFIAIAILCATADAQEQPPEPTDPLKPIPAIRTLIVPAIPTAAIPVTPAPPADPATIPTLIPGRLFVIQSQVKFKLFVSDAKLVNIRKVKGPRDISGVFADGDGSDEDRTYDAPFLAIVKAEKNQSGQVKLIYDPTGAEEESDATEILLLIGAGPRPPPDPVDPEPEKPIEPEPEKPIESALAKQLRSALVGTSAKIDAAKLQGMTSALADALEAGQFATHGKMLEAWKASQASTQWPEGRYPAMPDIMREVIPTVEVTVPIDAAAKTLILANLRDLEATSKLISEGK